MAMTSCRRTYDYRIRELASQAGDASVARHLGIPKSTVNSWLRRGMPDVVTMDVLDRDVAELQAEVVRLENRVRLLLAIVRLLFVVLRTCNLPLDGERLPSAEAKTKLLTAIESTRATVKLTTILRWLGLSSSRYHAWIGRRGRCSLDDRTSCPHSVPARLTPAEVNSIHDLANIHRASTHVGPRTRAACSAHRARLRFGGYLAPPHSCPWLA